VSEDLGGEVHGDIFASAEYRAAMAPVYVKRALAAAAARAGLG
jgi:CO/xanthine dehydrogenase FAD-binding subunit